MGQIEAVDLLCVGSGLAGLSAALAAAGRGLKSCVVEKSTRLGGGSAMSSGGVWIGANRHQAAHGHIRQPGGYARLSRFHRRRRRRSPRTSPRWP